VLDQVEAACRDQDVLDQVEAACRDLLVELRS